MKCDTQEAQAEHYVCLPIIAQGDTVGMLNIISDELATPNGSSEPESDKFLHFAQRCAEQISMAIANVKLRDELHEQSTRDPLTGLFNRRYFLECCRSSLSKIERESGSLALITFDADNFKSYNDQFGHDAGDSVLCSLSDIIRRFFSHDEVCCRIGGEEFSILLSDLSTEAAAEKARAFLAEVAAHEFRYRNNLLPSVTVSAGVASYPADANSLNALTRAADAAMYDAKELGKNCVQACGAAKTDPL